MSVSPRPAAPAAPMPVPSPGRAIVYSRKVDGGTPRDAKSAWSATAARLAVGAT